MPAIGPYAYPFDPSGAEVSNKVLNEIQVVTAVNSNEYHIVVPNFAPFFRASLIVLNGGTMTPLVEGTDFIFTHKYKEATINTAIPIYGSITLLNKNFSGVLVFQEYQTVGGQWTLTTTLINQILADKMLNPRITTWEQLGVAPEHFPVIDHMHVDPEELIGMPELVQAIEDVGIAVSGIVIDYDAINAYADSKIQDSMSPTQTTKASSVRAVLEALDAYVLDTQIVQDLNTPSTTNIPSVDAITAALSNIQTGIHVGETAPVSPGTNQLWWNSNLGRMFLWYNDGSTTQWVETSPGTGIVDALPVGSILPHGSVNVPPGYLECDGTAVSRTTYADLFAELGTVWGVGDGSTTFNLPDLRGEFLRGWDHGRGVDTGRVFGSHQDDMFESHTHDIFGVISTASGSNPGEVPGPGAGIVSGATGGTETRPRNYPVMFIIKAFGAVINPGFVDVANLASDVTVLQNQIAPLTANSGPIVYTPLTDIDAAIYTFPHGLGNVDLKTPTIILRCTDPDNEWVIGDKLFIGSDNNGTGSHGLTISYDATNVYVRIGSAGINIHQKTSYGATTPTINKWEMGMFVESIPA